MFYDDSKKAQLVEILKHFEKDKPLLIVTNEKNFNSLKWITDSYPKIVKMDICYTEEEKIRPIIDMLACCTAKKFMGTKDSTFSHYIQILRGFLSVYFNQISPEPLFIQQSGAKDNVKPIEKWNCEQGCWNKVDTSRWKNLNKPNNIPDFLEQN